MKTLDKSAVALRYYESLRANIVQGWEKYVLTDGKNCMFVNRTYQPAPGEAVFYFATRSRQTMCQLISVNAEEMYVLTPKGGLEWVVRDTIHDITVTFTEGMFNSTQEVDAPAKLTEVEAKNFPRWMREIGDWVAKNHYDIALCDAAARKSACKKLDNRDLWHFLAEALNGILYEDIIPADVALQAEVRDSFICAPHLLNGLDITENNVKTAVSSLTAEEAKEVLDMVKSFWDAERDADAWAEAAASLAVEDSDGDYYSEDGEDNGSDDDKA